MILFLQRGIFPVLSSFMTQHRFFCNQINTMGTTSAYSSGALEFTPGFQWGSCYSISSFILSTKIYDKRDDFNFKIINYPNMCSNIPASPAYGVFISQLIRYARTSSNYSDFLKRYVHLRKRLLNEGYAQIRLIRSFKNFIFRYQDLVEIYSVSAETIINDGFSYSENV